MKKLPKTLRIGAIDYKIIKRPFKDIGAFDNTSQYKGYCDREAGEIHLNSDHIEDSSDPINTLLHEILHALFREYCIDTDQEEYIVRCLSNGLCSVFKNNPKLLETVKENL